MPGTELEPPPPLPLPSSLPPTPDAPPVPTVLLPYEAPLPPFKPPQLVDETPLPVKAPEVVAAGVASTMGVGLGPFCVVPGTRAPSVTAPAVDWGSALCPWTTGGEPPLALVWVGVLPPTLAALVGVAPLAGVVTAPPLLPDPEEVEVALELVAGPAALEVAEDELLLLFPLPSPLPLSLPLPLPLPLLLPLSLSLLLLLPLPLSSSLSLRFPLSLSLSLPLPAPFALPLLPLPFPFPFVLLLPLPLLALGPTVPASPVRAPCSGDAAAA